MKEIKPEKRRRKMKATFFHGKSDVRLEQTPDPRIEHPRDAILRVTSTAICGSDLHIYNGVFPQPDPMILGHEFMGVIEDVGKEVTNLKKGDRVVIPFPIACGQCYFCQHDLHPHCENSNPKYGPEGGLKDEKGGALYGYTDLYGGYDGGQAEAVRIPYADVSPRVIPEDLTDEQVLFLTDILPTGWTSLARAKPKPGDTIAVFGCGPVGLMAQKSAWLFDAGRVIGVDVLPYRLEMARRVANSETIDGSNVDPVEEIRNMTEGRGADICIDAVGCEPERGALTKLGEMVRMEMGNDDILRLCFGAVRRGGTVSVMGVYGGNFDNFPVGQIFDKGLHVVWGQALVQKYIDHLLELIQTGKIVTDDIITHRFPLEKVSDGYEIFNKREDDCVKVVLTP
jgi:alcohol dehydrogenase